MGMRNTHFAKALVALVACIGVILYPDRDALAWGPGVHIAIGEYFLSNLSLLPPLVAELLRTYPSSFLYGALSADIFVGKGSTVHPTHSHNWNVAQTLRASAPSPKVQAYALGYLSHLAADTIAHNHYVPNMLSAMPMAGKLSHVYTEMLADNLVRWDKRKARRLLRRQNAEADVTLLAAMGCTKLPFVLKKHLVHNSLRLTERKSLGHSLDIARRHLAPTGVRPYFHDMFALSINVVGEVLRNPDSAAALAHDPVGTRALWSVKQIMRKRYRRKIHHGPRRLGTMYPVPSDLVDVRPPLRSAHVDAALLLKHHPPRRLRGTRRRSGSQSLPPTGTTG